MRRRAFIAALGGTVAWPLGGRGQPAGRPRRVGLISGATRDEALPVLAGLPEGLRELGYVEGRDFVMEWRFAEGRYERFDEFAEELARLKVDVIVLATSAAVRASQRASRTIPIVMGYSVDPVGNGFVASLARPGGNTTGLASLLEEITAKQLELIAGASQATHVGLLSNPGNPLSAPMLRTAEVSAPSLGLKLRRFDAQTWPDVERAFETLSRERIGAVVVAPDAFFHANTRRISELALQGRLVSMFAQREYVTHGGLMSYGENLFDFMKRAATYVDRIFKGADPGELPIEQPTRFYLAVNLKTARALRLAVPPALLARADEVIE
jgi:putative tryptophan/tyrosine transport system substrate-binding protein